MEYLFNSWETIASRIRESSHTILMLDFDGTLTPIVDRPEKAHLREEARNLLRNLAKHRHFTVAIVSGRAISDLQKRVGITGMVYVGNHGLEIEGPGFSFIHPVTRQIEPVLHVTGEVLEKKLGDIPRVIIENKGADLSIHYRLVDGERAEEVRTIVEDTIAFLKTQGKIKMAMGKKVYEIRPNISWDKGEAAKYIIRQYKKGAKRSGLLSIYLGDDLTDEDAFRVIEKNEGIAVHVGGENNASLASYYLNTTDEVELFMERSLQVRDK